MDHVLAGKHKVALEYVQKWPKVFETIPGGRNDTKITKRKDQTDLSTINCENYSYVGMSNGLVV